MAHMPEMPTVNLLSSFWHTVFFSWACSVLLTTTQVETRHSRNKKGSTKQVRWGDFVARYITREASTIWDQTRVAAESLIACAATGIAIGCATVSRRCDATDCGDRTGGQCETIGMATGNV